MLDILIAAFGGGLTTGTDPVTVFGSSTTNTFTSGTERFHYNTTMHTLLFDADGNGAGAAQTLATFTNSAVLAGSDFHLFSAFVKSAQLYRKRALRAVFSASYHLPSRRESRRPSNTKKPQPNGSGPLLAPITGESAHVLDAEGAKAEVVSGHKAANPKDTKSELLETKIAEQEKAARELQSKADYGANSSIRRGWPYGASIPAIRDCQCVKSLPLSVFACSRRRPSPPKHRPDGLGLAEASRNVDRRTIGQRDHVADTRDCYQARARLVTRTKASKRAVQSYCQW